MDIRTGTQQLVVSEETYTGARETDRGDERATEKSFSFGGKKKTGARFALHSWPSLWGEKGFLLRNVISMSSHNGPDNAAV